jgi:hypothetical protein
VPARSIYKRCAQSAERMRLTIIAVLGLLSYRAIGQSRTTKYHDYDGHKIEFREDSTFKYEYGFDLLHTWAVGKWQIKNDTIYLDFDETKVYDTLVRPNRLDSLVESRDEIPSRINEELFTMLQMSSGGQSSEGITHRLLKKHKRLYLIDNKGRVKGRLRGIWPDKRWWGYKTWPRWYVKER